MNLVGHLGKIAQKSVVPDKEEELHQSQDILNFMENLALVLKESLAKTMNAQVI